MDNQKGMTLIEVMVAMVILSVAMIGGISFFTSAYRINYTYIESANRIDHALRYVEKLKAQRRDYPTFGAFPNIGGNGFTAFFVDSEFNDNYDANPYFYENYNGGTLNIPVNVTIPLDPGIYGGTAIVTNGSAQPRGFYYWDEASKVYSSTGPYTSNLIFNDYPQRDYTRYRLSAYFQNAYNNDTPLSFGVSGVGEYYLNYFYNGVGTEDIDAYLQTTFEKMANYSKNNRYTLTYDNNRKMYKYNVRVNISQMFNTNPSYSSFPSGGNNTTITTPSGKVEQINNTYPNYYISPYSYLYAYGGSGASNAYAYYMGSNYQSNPIILQNGSVQENTGESSSIIGSEVFIFDSRRFYSVPPNMSNHLQYEIMRDSVESVYTGLTYKDYFDPDKTNLQNPDPVLLNNNNLYHRDAKYVALVYKGDATGQEQIHTLYSWYCYGGYPPSPGYVSPSTSCQYLYFSLPGGVGVNNHRVTRYRRSVYISLWPFGSDAAARALIREAIAHSPELNNRISYIKDKARAAGQKIIVIPFIQLYAEDSNSTLSEAL